VVDAFLAAVRDGDLDGLLAVLAPDLVARTDRGPGASSVLRGAAAVAASASGFADRVQHTRPVLVNGVAGFVAAPGGRPVSLMAFTVVGGRIVAIDALTDQERLARLDLTFLDG